MISGGDKKAHISAVSEQEVGAVVQLAREIWYLHYPGIITVSQIDYMLRQRYQPDAIASAIRANKGWWDKITVGPELAGFAGYELGSSPASVKLDKLYVHPRVQGRGFGYALLQHVEARSRERGFSRLYLQVNKGNTASIAFYRRAGFAVTENVVVDIGDGYVMDDFVMSKQLIGRVP
ncbi:MAG: GNAT family N-acetyltransferase [Betaproteobacteria bacterium]|jgi:ribosomal protein S18 acetylase RimI-like enzyme|nr:MAG: GNAT family N-acetyltransferase [Betaproteobacteria bacterium]